MQTASSKELAIQYSSLSDDELLSLSAEAGSLTDEARLVLDTTLAERNLAPLPRIAKQDPALGIVDWRWGLIIGFIAGMVGGIAGCALSLGPWGVVGYAGLMSGGQSTPGTFLLSALMTTLGPPVIAIAGAIAFRMRNAVAQPSFYLTALLTWAFVTLIAYVSSAGVLSSLHPY